MEVRVCAVIPVLNEEKFIAKCIESLLAQTMPVEILVMEGGSTDNTKQILAEFGDSIKVVENPGKRVSNARNLALEHIGKDITHCLEIIGHSCQQVQNGTTCSHHVHFCICPQIAKKSTRAMSIRLHQAHKLQGFRRPVCRHLRPGDQA